jgi:hypothetical protein
VIHYESGFILNALPCVSVELYLIDLMLRIYLISPGN